jgi:nucleoside-diphosphate-sugar epimerase
MKRIVVTGAAGRLGRLVVEDLVDHGYEVLGVDSVRPASSPVRMLTADLTEAAAVYDVLRGADGVIHLGAIPGPLSAPASTTFANNVMSTFHVAEAAAALGLKKLVFASSIFTLGWSEDARRCWPKYVPVDEDHPSTPLEAYGLSKQVGEDICDQVSRRWGLPVVSLRIMNVIQPGGYEALPWETPTPQRGVQFGLWPYVDVRDAARSCRLALEADVTGHEAVFIAAADIRFDAPTEPLLRELAPPELIIRRPLPGSTTVINLDKAARLIGYEPQFSWRDEPANRIKSGTK